MPLGNGIVVISLRDEAARNTFSHRLIEGLLKAFDSIRSMADAKVVVIHGYKQYFCTGGTQDELLGFAEGRLRFTDVAFYRLLLDCELPVIAAIQGHCIGGGLAFASFADLMVLAEEACVSANFMVYGFTPGMAATYIVPRRFGETLGNEMLFLGRNYFGHELKQRGVSFQVLPRRDVIPAAIAMARDLADMPVVSLKLLKQHLTEPVRRDLPAAVEAELAMHEVSFRQPEVRERILRLYHQGERSSP
jgi:polyketide biosynthesis enoyl-CoA hydratase PksI